MNSFHTVPGRTLQQLQAFDSCTISNAVEQFHVRTRNEGFVNGSVHCLFPEFSPKLGYAATARVRSSSTPISGRCYYDRLDWWSYVQTIPEPRFIVLEDIDHVPGLGALIGEVHAAICVALGGTALLTNGAVRDIAGIERSGFQVFANRLSVSHSYAHIVDFGEPVEIGGLQIKPGNLLHGDRNGVVNIPLEIAEQLPKRAAELLASEQDLIDFCRSDQFSFASLSGKIQHVSRKVGIPGGELNG